MGVAWLLLKNWSNLLLLSSMERLKIACFLQKKKDKFMKTFSSFISKEWPRKEKHLPQIYTISITWRSNQINKKRKYNLKISKLKSVLSNPIYLIPKDQWIWLKKSLKSPWNHPKNKSKEPSTHAINLKPNSRP